MVFHCSVDQIGDKILDQCAILANNLQWQEASALHILVISALSLEYAQVISLIQSKEPPQPILGL